MENNPRLRFLFAIIRLNFGLAFIALRILYSSNLAVVNTKKKPLCAQQASKVTHRMHVWAVCPPRRTAELSCAGASVSRTSNSRTGVIAGVPSVILCGVNPEEGRHLRWRGRYHLDSSLFCIRRLKHFTAGGGFRGRNLRWGWHPVCLAAHR